MQTTTEETTQLRINGKLTGTQEYYATNTLLASKLHIQADRIGFWRYETVPFTHEQVRKLITLKLENVAEWRYRQGCDNANQAYEIIEIKNRTLFWHLREMQFEGFQIQTWNRTELFCSMHWIAPSFKRGEKEMYFDTAIITLDAQSITTFATMIDAVRKGI
jgi:hypothetical protein